MGRASERVPRLVQSILSRGAGLPAPAFVPSTTSSSFLDVLESARVSVLARPEFKEVVAPSATPAAATILEIHVL